MCIAILNTSSLLAYSVIQTSFENNDDGAGLLWSENGALQVHKQQSGAKTFYKKYKAIRKRVSGPIVLHFRIGTHGDFSADNLHPFLINPDLGFVHNGIIQTVQANRKFSDTWHFNEYFLKLLANPAAIIDPKSREFTAVADYIGTGNKLVFLTSANDWQIVNESAGHWDNLGNWFSNYTYLESRYKDFGGQQVAKNMLDDWPSMDEIYAEKIADILGADPIDLDFEDIKKFYSAKSLSDVYDQLLWSEEISL
jgi:predicted glutamine amidotransferase